MITFNISYNSAIADLVWSSIIVIDVNAREEGTISLPNGLMSMEAPCTPCVLCAFAQGRTVDANEPM